MEITNNKVLKNILSSVFDVEDIESFSLLPNEVLSSQFSALGLMQKSPVSLLDSLYKIVSLDASNETWDFVTGLFRMKSNSGEEEYNRKKQERRKLLQRTIDQQNLDFEIGQVLYSSFTRTA